LKKKAAARLKEVEKEIKDKEKECSGLQQLIDIYQKQVR
jgi:hypothetical protein